MARHKRWIRILAGTVVVVVAGICLSDILLQKLLNLQSRPLDDSLRAKIHSLLLEPPRRPGIVIAGDSRAERQVIPEVLKKGLGVDTVNVAVAAGELIATTKALRQDGVLAHQPLLVVSVTCFQVNDGALDQDSISMDCLMAMRWTDQMLIFRKKLPEMTYRKLQMYGRCLRARLGLTATRKKPYPDDGFVGFDTVLDVSSNPGGGLIMEPAKITHPWYKDLAFGGRKWRVFQTALADLAGTGCPILLFSGPSSPVWHEKSDHTFVDAAERQYAQMIEQEAAQYPNVHFLDFHTGWTDEFPNASFYDIQHLNRTGATKLSEILCQEIQRLHLLSQ